MEDELVLLYKTIIPLSKYFKLDSTYYFVESDFPLCKILDFNYSTILSTDLKYFNLYNGCDKDDTLMCGDEDEDFIIFLYDFCKSIKIKDKTFYKGLFRLFKKFKNKHIFEIPTRRSLDSDNHGMFLFEVDVDDHRYKMNESITSQLYSISGIIIAETRYDAEELIRSKYKKNFELFSSCSFQNLGVTGVFNIPTKILQITGSYILSTKEEFKDIDPNDDDDDDDFSELDPLYTI